MKKRLCKEAMSISKRNERNAGLCGEAVKPETFGSNQECFYSVASRGCYGFILYIDFQRCMQRKARICKCCKSARHELVRKSGSHFYCRQLWYHELYQYRNYYIDCFGIVGELWNEGLYRGACGLGSIYFPVSDYLNRGL